jgi:LuxR family maltose regulon positive regulatory protein
MSTSNKYQVMPVIQEGILVYREDGRDYRLAVATPAWYAWLDTARTFAFRSGAGTFTARKEQAGHKRGGWYWRAYRKRGGKLHSAYLGTSEELTWERLTNVAAALAREVEDEHHLGELPLRSKVRMVRQVSSTRVLMRRMPRPPLRLASCSSLLS